MTIMLELKPKVKLVAPEQAEVINLPLKKFENAEDAVCDAHFGLI
jgi:hypothetical protein